MSESIEEDIVCNESPQIDKKKAKMMSAMPPLPPK
jgi:hypothetical protein